MVKASREFQIFAKPAGAACNLDCRYCYYLRKDLLYPDGDSFRMPGDLLEEYIRQQIAIAPEPEITFFWHGGEPTVLGIDYFRKIIGLERKHLPPGRRISNGIQTNGVLLDDDWCRFFAAENFTVGLSLDGPPALHDLYRVTKDGKPTHRQAMQGHRLLRKHKIPVDLLCVVHAENVRYPLEVYRFFKELKAHGFENIRTFELLKRDWLVDERRARPTDRMIAHTGFITVAKKTPCPFSDAAE